MSSASGTLVLIDGVLRSAEEATVSVFDRGFLYGDAVFETMRTYGGRPFALDEHLERLERSAERVLIRMPVSRAVLEAEIERGLREGGYAESVVRVVITRGQAASLGLDPARALTPLRLVIVAPLSPLPVEKYERGIRVITHRTQRVADGTEAAGAKITNYLVSVLVMDAAARRSAEEALLVDAEGRVLEGTTSNVFGVLGSELVTPPEHLGILAGITRAHVLTLARELGIPTHVRPIHESELARFDELFISSSIREIVPVVSVNETSVGTGRPGAVTQRLLTAFRAAARRAVGLETGSPL